jgi:hypothetical protein
MTRSRGSIGRRQLAREYPHRVAVPAERLRGAENSTPMYGFAKDHSGALPPLHLERDGQRFVVFCFRRQADAEAFVERFGGEIIEPE